MRTEPHLRNGARLRVLAATGVAPLRNLACRTVLQLRLTGHGAQSHLTFPSAVSWALANGLLVQGSRSSVGQGGQLHAVMQGIAGPSALHDSMGKARCTNIQGGRPL